MRSATSYFTADVFDVVSKYIQSKDPTVRVTLYERAEFHRSLNLGLDFKITEHNTRRLDRIIELRPLRENVNEHVHNIIKTGFEMLEEKETIRQCMELFCGISIP